MCGNAHTSTKVRASVGREARAVKEGTDRQGLSDGASCAIVCARLVPAHALACAVKRETRQRFHALNLCCPRNGKRPAAPVSPAMPHMRFFMSLSGAFQRMRAGRQSAWAASPDTGQTRRRSPALCRNPRGTDAKAPEARYSTSIHRSVFFMRKLMKQRGIGLHVSRPILSCRMTSRITLRFTSHITFNGTACSLLLQRACSSTNPPTPVWPAPCMPR
ncbi:MAG: hypothetical protein CPDRYMAC_6630 [uncultured Paraburkholderia sp.]|nr:MAG: hypothetical protein CPDRYDRY_6588 [uncultured Paraburkholderia sp.]CAH2944912.1 MAG: hypothetical protein CPDRYMAC_6630 [uncultured Paraburkholderia sp.]